MDFLDISSYRDISNDTGDNSDIPRITNGAPAEQGQFPWIVVLHDVQGEYICGGTLISSSTVLTAGMYVIIEMRLV